MVGVMELVGLGMRLLVRRVTGVGDGGGLGGGAAGGAAVCWRWPFAFEVLKIKSNVALLMSWAPINVSIILFIPASDL